MPGRECGVGVCGEGHAWGWLGRVSVPGMAVGGWGSSGGSVAGWGLVTGWGSVWGGWGGVSAWGG